MQRPGLGGPPLSPVGEAGVGRAALPRPQSKAPEDPRSNVITFRTPPSQRINDFDPTCECTLANLGGTVWFKQKLSGRSSSERWEEEEEEEEEERGGQMKVTAIEVNLDLKSQRGWKIPQG